MQVRNLTPHPHLVYANEDAQARLFDVLIVKSSFNLDDDFRLIEAVEQEPLNFSDTCYGAVNETALWYPSDLVPFKPVTDVVVVADAHAPEGKARADWECAVSVDGVLEKRLRVCGPREWTWTKRGGWTLGAPEKVDRVPVRWELAYGGEVALSEDNITTDERNPLGRGLIIDGMPQDPLPAPQIEAADQPVRDPARRYSPQSFGAIPPAWLPRRPLGGTYDKDWVENVWPHWAKDYDFAFHNCAATGMKADGFLQGGEVLRFENLRADCLDLRVTLPGDRVIAHLVAEDGSRRMVAMNLDTVYVDLLPEDPEECLIALTWRMAFLDAGLARVEIDSTVVANPIRVWAGGDGIVAAPHPTELFTKAEEPAHVE